MGMEYCSVPQPPQAFTFCALFYQTPVCSSWKFLRSYAEDADATQLSRWVVSMVCTEFATSWRQSPRVWTNLPTAKSSCVVLAAAAAWTHPSAVVTQFIISCAAELITDRLLRLMTTDDIVTSLLNKLLKSIKIHVVKPLWSLFGQFPNCRPNPSAVVVS